MEMLIGKLIVAEMKEIGLGKMKLIINKMLDMLLGEQQIIQTQMRRAWLGELKIIVAEMKNISLGEIKLIIDKMLEAARYERMHCMARSNTIPDYKYLGEMDYICQHCGAKKFPDETHFLCCHNGKVVLSQPSSFPQDLEDLFKGNYADRNANLNFFK